MIKGQHTEKVEKAEMEICFIKRKHKFSLAAVSLTKCHTDCENKRRVRSVDNLGECNHKLFIISTFSEKSKRFSIQENNHMIKIVTRPVERVQVST